MGESAPDFPESYGCGNYLGVLMDEGVIKPKNLVMYGVADYPEPEFRDDLAGRTPDFLTAYLEYENKGVTFISQKQLQEDQGADKLRLRLKEHPAPFLYISLDADVGAGNCTRAVRFLDLKGIDESSLISAASVINQLMIDGYFHLAGFDLCEVDVHLLGCQPPGYDRDRTHEVCINFFQILFSGYL